MKKLLIIVTLMLCCVITPLDKIHAAWCFQSQGRQICGETLSSCNGIREYSFVELGRQANECRWNMAQEQVWVVHAEGYIDAHSFSSSSRTERECGLRRQFLFAENRRFRRRDGVNRYREISSCTKISTLEIEPYVMRMIRADVESWKNRIPISIYNRVKNDIRIENEENQIRLSQELSRQEEHQRLEGESLERNEFIQWATSELISKGYGDPGYNSHIVRVADCNSGVSHGDFLMKFSSRHSLQRYGGSFCVERNPVEIETKPINNVNWLAVLTLLAFVMCVPMYIVGNRL